MVQHDMSARGLLTARHVPQSNTEGEDHHHQAPLLVLHVSVSSEFTFHAGSFERMRARASFTCRASGLAP